MIFSRFKWNSSTFLELSEATAAYIYYRKTRFNLLTGFPENYPLDLFLKSLEGMELDQEVKHPKVYHFHYELGLILQDLGHHVNETTPLAIEIHYSRSQKMKSPKSRLEGFKLKSLVRPSWSEYKNAFSHIQNELLAGNCYQVNLTYPFEFETEESFRPKDITDSFFSLSGLGAYAHSTFLGDEMILSNSPECLFQYQKGQLFTMPIKGTKNLTGKDWKKVWKELKKDIKEEGELNMITDLLRNDLNRLDEPNARVIKLKAPLLVPGLLHQYSLISVKIKKKVSLLKTLECLFPGGSVTGAPKKRVMDIIQHTERSPRGPYCGSTLLCYGRKKVASINIRTATLSLNDKIWKYGAGGGITLLSKNTQEFQEMESKVSSFLTLLKVPGYVQKKP